MTPDGCASSCSAWTTPTLAELLAAGEISRKEGVRIVYSVAAAVEALRRAGLVARDLRPGRILVSAERGAILADTGVPLELMPRTLRAGDPEAAFRSPEERAGRPIGARSNVYSLGVLLRAVLDRPVSSGLPKQVETVIARATATDPERRYAGPREFIVAALRRSGTADPPAPGRRHRAGSRHGGSPGGRSAAAPARATEKAPARGEAAAARARAGAGPLATARSGARPLAKARAGAAPARETPRRSRPARANPPSLSPACQSRPCRGPACPGRRCAFPRSRDRTFGSPPFRVRGSQSRGSRNSAAPLIARGASRPSVRALGIVVALAACVIGGLLLAKLVGEKDGGTQLSSAALSVQLPDGWDGTKVDREPSIALSAPVAAAPLGESGTGLVAGRVEDAAELDKRLSAESTQRTEVTLGRLEAWRYSGLEPEQGLAAVAYLAPTSDGSVLVICHARPRVAPDRLRECEAIASTIVLRGARPAALASVGEGRRAVSEVMERLRAERRAARRELAGARHAPEQARAARELEASYRDAADSLESSPAIEGEADSLAESLRAAASAYEDLAAAAKDGDRSRYREASRLIAEREAAVERGAAEPLSA